MAIRRGGLSPSQQAEQQALQEAEMQQIEQERMRPVPQPMTPQEEIAVAAEQAAQVQAMPSLLDTPAEELSARMRLSPQGFVGEPGRELKPQTLADEMSQQVIQQGPNAIAAALTGTPTPDQFGRVSPRTQEESEAMVNAALQQSAQMAPMDMSLQQGQPSPFMSTTGVSLAQEVRNRLPGNMTTRGSLDSYNKIVSLGKDLGGAFARQAGASLQGTDEVSVGLQQALINGGLFDRETNQITPRFNNIAAFTLLEMMQNELLVKNTLAVEGYDPNSSSEVEDLAEYESLFELEDDADVTDIRTKGVTINPALARMDPTDIVFDRALPNPNKIGDVYTAYGGGSTTLSPETKTAFKYLYYTALKDLGFLTERVDGRGYEMSEEAIDYFFKSRDVLTDIMPNLDQLPSLVENIEGQTMGAERGRGFKKSGNVSNKTLRPYGDNLELQAMHHMGRIQHRIDDDMLTAGQLFVHEIVKGAMLPNGKVILNKNQPLADMPKGTQFKLASTHPYAKRIGLDVATWQRHYHNARINGQEHADAADQADAIMASKARRLLKEVEYGVQLAGRTLYMRKLYATSTSRFHDRNTIISPQANKFVRNILGSALPIMIDVRNNNEIHQVWKYLMGRTLLNSNDLAPISAKYDNEVTVEDMGFNETLKLAEEKIFKERYDTLVKLGKQVRDIIKNPNKEFSKQLEDSFNDLGEQKLANKLNDPEEWGFVLKALLDIAEYDNHRLAAGLGADRVTVRKGTPEIVKSLPTDNNGNMLSPRALQLQSLLEDAMINQDQDAIQTITSDLEKEMMDTKIKYPETVTYGPVFRPKLLGKFDGKSSGQALQGALFGNEEVMKKTGIMFESFENVVPFGTIRTQFLDRIVPRKPEDKSILKGIFNKEDEKLSFWTSFFEQVMASDNRKLLETSLAKKPIMETSYEKSTMFQHKAAREISFNFNLEQQLKDSVLAGRYPLKEAILDLNEIIKSTLEETLSLENQKLMRDIGAVWGLLLNRKARFITPTGKTIAIGSRNRVESEKSITFPTATGETTVPIYRYKYTSTDKTKKEPKVYNPEKMHMEAGGTTRYTQEVANQLPVLVIQAIDASIMAMTFNSVNEGLDTPLYAIDIHDALMLDARSTKAYHTTYNRILEELVSPTSPNGYKVWKSIAKPIQNELISIRDELKNNSTPMQINFENMETRGIHQILNDFEQMRLGNQIGFDYTTNLLKGTKGAKGLEKSKQSALAILKYAKDNGWTPEGGVMPANKVNQLIFDMVTKYYMIDKRLKDAQTDADKNAFEFARNRKVPMSLNLN